MTALAIAGILFAMGFARYELPAAVDRYRRKLERDRLHREALKRSREEVQAALALAIDKKWREFGCARGLTEAEALALQERSRSTWPPPIGPSPIRRLTTIVNEAKATKRPPAPNPTRPSKRRM